MRNNVKDLAEIPDNVKRNIDIIPVATVDEVIENALEEPVKPIEWGPESESVEPVQSTQTEGDLSGVTTH